MSIIRSQITMGCTLALTVVGGLSLSGCFEPAAEPVGNGSSSTPPPPPPPRPTLVCGARPPGKPVRRVARTRRRALLHPCVGFAASSHVRG